MATKYRPYAYTGGTYVYGELETSRVRAQSAAAELASQHGAFPYGWEIMTPYKRGVYLSDRENKLARMIKAGMIPALTRYERENLTRAGVL